jgi:hypothetical protein
LRLQFVREGVNQRDDGELQRACFLCWNELDDLRGETFGERVLEDGTADRDAPNLDEP